MVCFNIDSFVSQNRFDLLTKFAYKNCSNIPALKKIVLSIGVKESNIQKNTLLVPFFLLFLITGQKPIPTKAKKSVALYKLRRGMFSGVRVTLRNKKMYNFLLKLLYIALPRNKDFLKLKFKNSLSNNMVSIGLKNLSVFPEIEKQVDNNIIKGFYGCNVTFVISSSNFANAQLYLNLLGLPFIK